ncbi:MAG: TAT-variant-translocated molybdopterin oxidoreductase [Acidobacteriota bacterium]
MPSLSDKEKQLDLTAIRAHLNAQQGKDYWRSLEELAETTSFVELLSREFPQQASQWSDPIGRRQFLKLMGASLALAGLSACTQAPKEQIMPYVRAPEEIVPGRPLFYATAMPQPSGAIGLLVESHMGRPTKVEGNPEHPASLGATDIFAQAAVLTLYDPDRSQTVTYLGEIRPWTAFIGALRTAMEAQRLSRGAGLRILTETVTSPTLIDQIQSLLRDFPQAKWLQYQPVGRDMIRAGAQLAIGQDIETNYHIDKADVIVALDADFLSCSSASLAYARQFAARRRNLAEAGGINRLYAVETMPSSTGAVADHRWPLRASEIEAFAYTLANGLKVPGIPTTTFSALPVKWLTALIHDLEEHRGRSIIIPGQYQPATVHALAHTINSFLGNIGNTVFYTDPIETSSVDQQTSLSELVQDMEAGRVELLVIVSINPVYDAPVDLQFAQHLERVKLRVHLSLYNDETSALCHWHIPEAHFLETWTDTRAYDGTVSIVQPLIAPLYLGKSAHELLTAFTEQPDRSSYDIVRDYWQRQRPGEDFERFWRKALHDGLIPNTTLSIKTVSLKTDWLSQTNIGNAQSEKRAGLEIVFRPDPTIFDGRFSNNGWLQELPKPITKLTWDNAVMISPATATRLGLQNEELVELHYQGRSVRAPIWIVPGHANDSVTIHLGYGRSQAGRVGNGAGFNGYLLRTSIAPWYDTGLEIRPTGMRYQLARTQSHYMLEGRNLVHALTFTEYQQHTAAESTSEHKHSRHLSLYPEHKYQGYAWGMAIDLTTCIGCNACVIACQAENNIPVVGKAQVIAQREMHWLRIDTYFKGGLDNPAVYFQPIPCMQCENAPCEVVCPVTATAHSDEGLNDMVYNRCVGTRYCSNNCPYKVRRFNFLSYSDYATDSLKLLRNPDVTVRSLGVMEKCTYCVQRINYARIEAEKEDRRISDGEILTACQAVCPSEAIIFGDINDPNSRVTKLKHESRNYELLGELNTKPRTTYLSAVRNPNPEIEEV